MCYFANVEGTFMPATAKIFITGRSQAVRLPKEFRFQGEEVFIRRDPKSGDVILTAKPADWLDFFALADATNVANDFLSDRETPPSPERDLF
jgi:antitoxin VapB